MLSVVLALFFGTLLVCAVASVLLLIVGLIGTALRFVDRPHPPLN